jgi:PAS domain S-box-containing protein
MLDADGRKMVATVGIGNARRYLGQTLERGVGLAGQVWLTGQPILVTDYDAYAKRLPSIAPGLFHSLAALPLCSGAQVIGVLGIGFKESGREFSSEEMQTLTRFAQVAAVTIDNARLYAVAQQELAERQRTEAELTAQRDFAVQVMNTMGQGLTITDGQGCFEFVNPAYAAMLGCQPQDVIGKSPRDVTAPADQDVLEQARADRAAGKLTSYETRLLRADGSAVYAFITSAPRWRNGQVDGAIAVITDLTERMRMEEALRDSEAAIRGLYAIVSDHALTFSQKVQAMLDMGCRRFGLENGILSRIEGRRYAVLEARSPGGAIQPGAIFDLDATYCREALDSADPVSFDHASASDWRLHPCYQATRLEAYLGARVMVNGGVFGTLNFSSAAPRALPIRSIDGEFARLMAQWIGSEIEREQYVAQLRNYADEIARKNADLALARDQALEASRLKSEFLATVSHEIRTPLTIVIGMTELLLDTPLAPEQRDFAGTVQSSAQSLLAVINDILDFSRIEAGRMILERIPFEPASLIRQACAALEPGARAKGLSLTAHLGPGLPARAAGDPARLRQILLNLIGNAVKFTSAGAVRVSATLEEDQPDRVMLRFSVSDTGIGMPAAALSRLFQPFTQVDGSTTRKYGGAGLGLALCKGLVELMGGRIGAESQEGQGSTFWLVVPLDRLDPPTRPADLAV